VSDRPRRYVLTITCPDRTGIVAAVSTFIAEHGGWVLEAAQHGDLVTGQFFMRIEVIADSLRLHRAEFEERFGTLAEEFALTWNLTDTAVPRRVVILVSKLPHCLADLLYRWESKDLEFEIPCVVSNHDDLRPLVERHQIPFHHVSLEGDLTEGFERIATIFDEARGDTMVLARFMQVLPAWMCERYENTIVNIHHSFLPSFAGGRPYHKALERGVKLIGATCHYVTADLDAGPIIEQDTARIDHGGSLEDLVQVGRDIERSVLARGLRWHLEDRVLFNGSKTVVFS
jgi:formyltetrahydrofolate deformylase